MEAEGVTFFLGCDLEDGVDQKWPQGEVTGDTLSLSSSSSTEVPRHSHQDSSQEIQRLHELQFTQQLPQNTTLS